MKTIGMLGGMSWESTESYYRMINEGVKNKLGGLNSAKICMVSVNFNEIEKLQHQGEWQKTADILGPVYLCSLFLLEAIFMLSKAEVMQCSHSTLMTDNEVECKNSPSPSG